MRVPGRLTFARGGGGARAAMAATLHGTRHTRTPGLRCAWCLARRPPPRRLSPREPESTSKLTIGSRPRRANHIATKAKADDAFSLRHLAMDLQPATPVASPLAVAGTRRRHTAAPKCMRDAARRRTHGLTRGQGPHWAGLTGYAPPSQTTPFAIAECRALATVMGVGPGQKAHEGSLKRHELSTNSACMLLSSRGPSSAPQ
jgi:hypothetical protein